jgi:CspA family cold shock protein
MPTGTVKFFNSQKGFGFIEQTGGGPDVFVHVSAVERAGMPGLVEGQKLSFDIVTERGKQAASNLKAGGFIANGRNRTRRLGAGFFLSAIVTPILLPSSPWIKQRPSWRLRFCN